MTSWNFSDNKGRNRAAQDNNARREVRTSAEFWVYVNLVLGAELGSDAEHTLFRAMILTQNAVVITIIFVWIFALLKITNGGR